MAKLLIVLIAITGFTACKTNGQEGGPATTAFEKARIRLEANYKYIDCFSVANGVARASTGDLSSYINMNGTRGTIKPCDYLYLFAWCSFKHSTIPGPLTDSTPC